jgi:hypothetical protein
VKLRVDDVVSVVAERCPRSCCLSDEVVAGSTDRVHMKTTQRSHRLNSVLLALAAGVLLVGCGDSSDSSDSSTTATSSSPAATTSSAPVGCADLAALQASAQTLSGIEPVQDGTNALNAALADTHAALETVLASASAELQPVVEQVGTAFDAVQTASAGLTADTLMDQAPGIVAALQGLNTALTALATTLTQECPES